MKKKLFAKFDKLTRYTILSEITVSRHSVNSNDSAWHKYYFRHV